MTTIFIEISLWMSINRERVHPRARTAPSDAMRDAPEMERSLCGVFESSSNFASKFVRNEKRDIQGQARIGPDRSPPQSLRARATAPSIAVQPFVNLSGGARQDYLADGAVEDILAALSHIR
jgi:hypothetical protein